MSVRDLLEHDVEGYLFGDLKSMDAAEHRQEEGGGGCGYPMLFSTLSGMAFVGFLLRSDESVDTTRLRDCGRKGCNKKISDEPHLDTRENLRNYWMNVLGVVDQLYAEREPLINALSALVRNPLAHSPFIAPNITVYKGNGAHLQTRSGRNLEIDARRLANDFKRSYQELVPAILSGQQHRFARITATAESVERRFGEVRKHMLGLGHSHSAAMQRYSTHIVSTDMDHTASASNWSSGR